MKLYPSKKIVQPIKPISNSNRNSFKLSTPKEISINVQSTPTPINSNDSVQNDQKQNKIEQKNNYFSLEDEYRLKYVEKCLMKALRSGNKLNEYQLKVNSEIIKKLKAAVQSKSKQNKEKDKYNLIFRNRKSFSTKENKQNEDMFSNRLDSQMENRNGLKHISILEMQKKQKKKLAINQNYYTYHKRPHQSIRINNYCKIYESNYLENVSSNESIGQQINENKQKDEPKKDKQKYHKRTLRTNENYLINTNAQNMKGNYRGGYKNKKAQYSDENERNTSQNQSLGSKSSQMSKRIIKINNKPQVIIMKTVNNNFNCSKDTKTQRKAQWDSSTSKIMKVPQDKNSIKSFSPNQPIRKSIIIENNQDRIKQICEDINKLKEQSQKKDQELFKYEQQAKKLRTQNEELLKKIEQNKEQIRLDLKLSLRCIQTPNSYTIEQKEKQSVKQRENINCGYCEKSQQKAKYLSQKVIDLQMMLISQNNQIQNLRESLSEYMMEPKNSNMQSSYSKSKQTFCSDGKQKQNQDQL